MTSFGFPTKSKIAMKKLIILLAMGIFVSLCSTAQVVELQKTYTITKKSKRGVLGNAEYDSEKGHYYLTYVTKSNDKMARFEVYTFDRDFNFVALNEEEIEFEKARTKYKWFNFKGEEYSVIGNFVEPNLTGTLVIRKKKITYKYDWLVLGYYTKVDVLEKVKPKNADGDKLFYYGHVEDDNTGDIMVLCGVKEKIGKDTDPYGAYKNFTVVKFNLDLELVGQEFFSFDYPQTIVFQRALPARSDKEFYSGLAAVFAPMGGPGMGKVQSPEINDYTFVSMSPEAKVMNRVSFKSPASYWPINELIMEMNTGWIYMYGPAAPGKDKHYNLMLNTQKFATIQLIRINGDKVDFLTETNLETINSLTKTPANQKKTPEYKGKRFAIQKYAVAGKGDLIVVGQNFDNTSAGPDYKEILGFHFDPSGNMKALYGINPMESNNYSKLLGAQQELIESSDGKKLIWIMMEIEGIAAWNDKPLFYPSVSSIDLESGDIGNFENVGKMGKDQYYLDQKFPMLPTDHGEHLVFFGSDKKGAEIWFTRMLLK